MKVFILLLAIASPASGAKSAVQMLFDALLTGDLKTIETLISNGLSPDQPDRFGRTPLGIALQSNQTRAAELLLSLHADPNAPLNNRNSPGDPAVTPLQQAALSGNIRMATMLLGSGADINGTGPSGRTALTYAGGHLDMMQFLIRRGVDVNARDLEGASALDNAAWSGSIDDVAILLAHGAHVNDPNTQTGATPVNEAGFRGHADVVQYLLQFHPELETPDKRGFTALVNAIRMGKEETALVLLEAGAKNPPECLEFAVKKDEAQVTEALLHNGAKANAALPSGSTPLDLAASAGSIGAISVLLNNGADPNFAGPNGTSPLEDASLKGYDSVATALLDHGARVNQVNAGSGTTALYAAASFGKAGMVKLLLDRGADPALCGRNRTTPYQAALANGYTEVVSLLQARPGAKACKQ
jgi:ankyrin repeat protein